MRNIIESLRRGEVPNEELDKIIVDRMDIIKAFKEDIEYFKQENSFKTRYLNGEFGSGKTFLLKILSKKGFKENFVVSYVVLDEKNTRFDKLENLYKAILFNLQIQSFPPGSVTLAEIISRWLETKMELGKTKRSEIHKLTPGNPMLSIILHAYQTKPEFRPQILSWLMREKTITANEKKEFHVKGDIDRSNCLAYLNAISKLIQQAGFNGWIIIFDEVESIIRLTNNSRLAALENIRLLDDNQVAALSNTGMFFAGTSEFFGEHGVKDYKALESRIENVSEFKSHRHTILKLESLEKKYRKKLLSNIKEIYEEAYNTSLPGVSEKVIEQAEEKAANRKLTMRELIKRWVNYFDLISV
ncbi:MAG: DUF2791 family P-loop domain-containing protein [Thaumarchaeota archaeon]|nr:DUF2791 family P-loop domain-containing protein [Nitrososphaerota archaeon]